ncbi:MULTISPECIES: S24 family peptidase [unclassified Bradyrhizobium]|uniref:S24 family peptidase n=1 Tax=unclassified Bradyrhizobium TaxID=2631580 RepID=UPI001BAB8DF2|nr:MULTISPECIES: S24 family peptidase [unclassified Bradyrhizobium]MBR1206592.1 helix-turn-helix transcriptional regulator [Bradyrhizobium sp. AUGA SZCCT0124]MBR1315430.1 helix-turn-helix transcriptional regulator [Bradyrhizobium sp. AUGA SZCCT0051]MBR1338508.1 helix-turn-helix transcriptional regulator [Bradyrhizobium sp. AUGA SZCCT0105]MBR1356163.1 helix-turn-helix transcriptional regulator [Bradyrhizobium sp. AUGA SZCCT0045]
MKDNDLKPDMRSRMAARLAELDRSPITAAANVGLERTYIRDFINGKKASIRSDKHEQVARALDWTVAELLGAGPSLMADVPAGKVKALTEPPPPFVPGNQLVGIRDFPIYAAAQGGEGFMIVHTDVMEWVKRPVILEGVPDSYGVLVVGESMVPAYRPGDMALVHPRRPPERGTDVILYDHDPRTGDAKSMIKHLISFNDRSFKLEQYNPAKTFSEHRADWPICHQVVGMYKGRR